MRYRSVLLWFYWGGGYLDGVFDFETVRAGAIATFARHTTRAVQYHTATHCNCNIHSTRATDKLYKEMNTWSCCTTCRLYVPLYLHAKSKVRNIFTTKHQVQ